ncbi:MAG: M48 family metalloprotease [Bdellovibrionales bacterium]|nr:M48 family metalloprotease [Bdellovibrionales bacterium]
MNSRVIKTWLLVLFVAGFIIFLGEKSQRRDGLIVAVFFALSIIFLLIYYANFSLEKRFKTQRIEGHDPQQLLTQTQNICKKMHWSVPKIYRIQSQCPQAFALGYHPKSGKIFLSEGLLQRLTPQETQAVLIYNLALLQQRSSFIFSVAGALAEAVLSVGYAGDSLTYFFFKAKNQNQSLGLFSLLLAPVAGGLLHFTISKKVYFNADKMVVKVMGEGTSFSHALWKLQSYAENQPFHAPIPQAHFFIVNPLTGGYWNRYFRTQPQVSERIKALVGYFPI